MISLISIPNQTFIIQLHRASPRLAHQSPYRVSNPAKVQRGSKGALKIDRKLIDYKKLVIRKLHHRCHIIRSNRLLVYSVVMMNYPFGWLLDDVS
jgi:hypothetical protein